VPRNSYAQPALYGGLVMGVLSALPFVAAGNICCCLWVVSGGLVAAYVLQQNQAAPITAANGAIAGLLAGLVGAFVHLLISIPIGILMAPLERAVLDRLLEITSSMPPDVRSYVEQYAIAERDSTAGGQIARRIGGFIFMLFVGGIFSTVGGLIGAAIFKKPADSAG
jgi:hypothetical protein